MKQVFQNWEIAHSVSLAVFCSSERFPNFKPLAKVALVILLFCVVAECGFILQNKIKMVKKRRRSETKAQILMVSAAIFLDAYDYGQASTQFKALQTRRKV